MSGPELIALLVGAGVLAGVVGTAGGITSLISYPALLLAGVPALEANIANLVALAACWPAAAAASRPELREIQGRLPAGLVAAAVGGAAGTTLLLLTPGSVFDDLVPLLVATGSVVLLLQPRLTRLGATRAGRRQRVAVVTVVAVVSVYGGYFGAGSGVMLLAVCLVLMDPRVPVANAMKNMFVGAAALTSAVILVAVGPVPWHAVLPLAAGLFLGSLVGPVLARRLPATAVRWSVALLGLVLAVELLVAGR